MNQPLPLETLPVMPWVGLGQRLPAGASPAEWAAAAGLNWSVDTSPIYYEAERPIQHQFKDKVAILRSDTHEPLAIVSNKYKVVQPATIIEFFTALTENAGFEMETAGLMSNGRQIWAQARVGPNAKVMDDEVAPYLLLATSYDQSLPTIGGFVTKRIWCGNMIRAMLQSMSGENSVRVRHASEFNSAAVREKLSIAVNSWEEFLFKARELASQEFSSEEFSTFLHRLLGPSYGQDTEKITKSKPYKEMLSLFEGGQIGAEMDAIKSTKWGALNSVTQYADHISGKNQSARLTSAWFGYNADLKDEAFAMLTT